MRLLQQVDIRILDRSDKRFPLCLVTIQNKQNQSTGLTNRKHILKPKSFAATNNNKDFFEKVPGCGLFQLG